MKEEKEERAAELVTGCYMSAAGSVSVGVTVFIASIR